MAETPAWKAAAATGGVIDGAGARVTASALSMIE